MATVKQTTPNKKPAAAATSKPASKAGAAAKPIALVTDDGVPTKAATDKAESLKKKELIARVVAAVGAKKGGVKDVVEATLTVLGEALQAGESLNLPPFGKARIAKSKGEGKSSALTVKLRGAGAKKAPGNKKETLAEVGEDS